MKDSVQFGNSLFKSVAIREPSIKELEDLARANAEGHLEFILKGLKMRPCVNDAELLHWRSWNG